MASATADLQRDLGGAIMQSIFGALLTAGYTAAANEAIQSSGRAGQINEEVQATLTKSFAGAADLAHRYPEYADRIIPAAQESFLQGDERAYIAGIVAVVLGAALVFFVYPGREEERALLDRYHEEDA
jgi:hypothetical protein